MGYFFIEVCMSFPSPADDYREKPLRLDDLIVHREATYFVRHTGLSMEPTLHNDDVLIVDRALIPLDNQVVVVRLHEQFMTRRIISYDDGYILLIADNPAFLIIEVTDEDEDFDVWGVVTYAIHKFRAPTRKI
jgi:DNA polymerase V